MPTADVLDALCRLGGWRVDALRGRLAAASRERAAADHACSRIERQQRLLVTGIAAAPGCAIDPASRGRLLLHLADLSRQWSPLHSERAARTAEVAALQRRLDLEQGRLDGLERQREAQRGEWRAIWRRREAAAHDRDWLAQRHATASVRRSA